MEKETISTWITSNIERTPIISSMASLQGESQVEFYPNPIRDEFTIRNHSDEVLQVSFMDINGKAIGDQWAIPSNSATTSDLSYLIPGIYLLRIDGTRTTGFHKLIKL